MKKFPPFRLDLVNQCLWRRGEGAEEQRILLTPKAFAMLLYLVEHAGRLVTHDELLEVFWSETYVQPEVLKSHIRDIRAALGDNPKNPRFIETQPRRGYRFVAPVSDDMPKANLQVDYAAGRLVGRNVELGELRGFLQRSLQGERQLVFVTGEPGIGKTSLVDAFQYWASAENQGLRIARGQCVEGYGGKEPYYPMLEALGQLCRGPAAVFALQVLASHAPTWLAQFPALVKPEQRENLQREIVGSTRERMLREIADALETIAVQSPILLVFEDLHWVDPSTVDLISVLARRRQAAKLMMIGTYRPVDLALAEHPLKSVKQDLLIRSLCHEIALRPLDEMEVAEFLAVESAGAVVPKGLAGLIYRHSEGNPLFMVAALTHMRDRGLVVVETESWQIKLPVEEIEVQAPDTLRQMIELQLSRLSAEEQRVLEVMSVLKKFSLSLIVGSAVANIAPEDLEGLLEGLAKRHQVVRRAGSRNYRNGPSPCYEFVHVLYRDVLYSRIAPAGRRKLHKSTAENEEALHLSPGQDIAFPEADMANELAHHFEQSGDWPRAIKYLQIAADTAGRRFEPKQAAETLEHALELVNKIPEAARAQLEIEVLQKLCTVYSASFDPRALQTCEALAGRAAHYALPEVEVHALLEMAFPLALVSSEHYLRALDRTLEVHLQSGEQDPLKRTGIRALYLCRRAFAGKEDSSDLEECRSLLAILRESDDGRLFGEVQLAFGYTLFHFSDYREARRGAVEGFADFVEGYDEGPYLTWHFQLHQYLVSSCPLFLGEWGEALRKIEQYIEMVEKSGDRNRSIIAHLQRVELQIHVLDFAGALQLLESAFSMVGPIPTVRRNWQICAGSAEAGLGNHERALEHLLRCREEMDQHPLLTDWYNRMPLEWALTEAWLSKGDLAQARGEAEQFLSVTLTTQERTWRALAFEANTRVAMAEGDLPTAQDFITRAEQETDGFEVPLATWRVHATAAELYERKGERDPAKEHRRLSCATIMRLANSLPSEEPLRTTFLAAPIIRKILG